MTVMAPEGFYGIFSLNGAPITEEEVRLLPTGCNVACAFGAPGTSGFCIVVDNTPLPGDTGCTQVDNRTLVFLGDLDDAPSLAKRLGLPEHTPACRLALAAIDRWGDTAPIHLDGIWTLLLWDETQRSLTLVSSRLLRDQTYIAIVGDRVAVAPSQRALTRLPWLDPLIDQTGLLLSMARAQLRAQLGQRTLFQNVERLLPGTLCHFRQGHQTSFAWTPPLLPEEWGGDLSEAVAELELRARCAVRRHLRRHRTIAVTLSGGLDSSTLAWLATVEKRPNQRVIAVASAARPESGIADERRWIDAVSRELGIETFYVTPDSTTDVFTPAREWFSYWETPLVTYRHYVYMALYAAARAQGADVILDGEYGETSLTRTIPTSNLGRELRTAIKATLHRIIRRRVDGSCDEALDHFHVMIPSATRHALLPPLACSGRSHPTGKRPSPQQPMGFPNGIEKSFAAPEGCVFSELRHIRPFRAPALLTLSAGLPGRYTQDGPYARALARHLLRGRLPDEVRLRTTKLPFSPEHEALLQRQARTQASTLAASTWEANWIDLPWLRRALIQIAEGRAASTTRMAAQTAAAALAFFHWMD